MDGKEPKIVLIGVLHKNVFIFNYYVILISSQSE